MRTFVMVDETTEVEKNIDVVLDTNGHFIHLAQGISLTIPPKTNIPPFLFKPKRALTCYSLNGAALDGNEHLMFIEDSETHAMIVPKYDMHILEYEKHLEATRPLWEVQNDDEE